MDYSRQEYWSLLPFPTPRGSSQPRDRTLISCVSCIGRQILYHSCRVGSPRGRQWPLLKGWEIAVGCQTPVLPQRTCLIKRALCMAGPWGLDLSLGRWVSSGQGITQFPYMKMNSCCHQLPPSPNYSTHTPTLTLGITKLLSTESTCSAGNLHRWTT